MAKKYTSSCRLSTAKRGSSSSNFPAIVLAKSATNLRRNQCQHTWRMGGGGSRLKTVQFALGIGSSKNRAESTIQLAENRGCKRIVARPTIPDASDHRDERLAARSSEAVTEPEAGFLTRTCNIVMHQTTNKGNGVAPCPSHVSFVKPRAWSCSDFFGKVVAHWVSRMPVCGVPPLCPCSKTFDDCRPSTSSLRQKLSHEAKHLANTHCIARPRSSSPRTCHLV